MARYKPSPGPDQDRLTCQPLGVEQMKMQKDPKTFSTTKSRREKLLLQSVIACQPTDNENKKRRHAAGISHRQEKKGRVALNLWNPTRP